MEKKAGTWDVTGLGILGKGGWSLCAKRKRTKAAKHLKAQPLNQTRACYLIIITATMLQGDPPGPAEQTPKAPEPRTVPRQLNGMTSKMLPLVDKAYIFDFILL